MRRIIGKFNRKKILLYIFSFATILIIVPAIFISIGNKINKEGSYIVPKFNVNKKNVIFNENNGGGPKIRVYITKEKKIREMYLEEYVRGVLCGEMPVTFDIEALKAQAVASRTYALSHMKSFGGTECKEANGGNVCDTVHCQVYMSKETRFNDWTVSLRDKYWIKVTDAVEQTKGQVLTYNGKLVLEPLYFAVSSGKTENGSNVFTSAEPYLSSVKSEGEESALKYKTTTTYSYNWLASVINKEYPKAIISSSKLKNQVKIISHNSDSGSVKEIKLGSITISGTEFRHMININSSNFTINYNKNNIEIKCMGYGHGVGMSQWGANVMAKKGNKYDVILTHYYQGVKIENLDTVH